METKKLYYLKMNLFYNGEHIGELTVGEVGRAHITPETTFGQFKHILAGGVDQYTPPQIGNQPRYGTGAGWVLPVFDFDQETIDDMADRGIVPPTYTIRVVLNNGTQLHPDLFRTDTYDNVNFREQYPLMTNSRVFVETIPRTSYEEAVQMGYEDFFHSHIAGWLNDIEADTPSPFGYKPEVTLKQIMYPLVNNIRLEDWGTNDGFRGGFTDTEIRERVFGGMENILPKLMSMTGGIRRVTEINRYDRPQVFQPPPLATRRTNITGRTVLAPDEIPPVQNRYWSLVRNDRRTRFEDFGVTLHRTREEAMEALLQLLIDREEYTPELEREVRRNIFDEGLSVQIHDIHYAIVPSRLL